MLYGRRNVEAIKLLKLSNDLDFGQQLHVYMEGNRDSITKSRVKTKQKNVWLQQTIGNFNFLCKNRTKKYCFIITLKINM